MPGRRLFPSIDDVGCSRIADLIAYRFGRIAPKADRNNMPKIKTQIAGQHFQYIDFTTKGYA
jgi:hypothetical protein